MGYQKKEIEEIIEKGILHDPVVNLASIRPIAKDFDWIIEVGFRPGVTDNEGRIAKEAIKKWFVY